MVPKRRGCRILLGPIDYTLSFFTSVFKYFSIFGLNNNIKVAPVMAQGHCVGVTEMGCGLDPHSSKLNTSIFFLVLRISAALNSNTPYAIASEFGRKCGNEVL